MSGLRGRYVPDPNDFIIAFMGPTGSGRTNFINHLTGNAEKRKAALLDSATQNVTPYIVPHHASGQRLVLVDTPAFDNTCQSDREILKLISDWLTKKYPDGETLKLTGIIYFHRITDNQMSGPAYRSLRIFGQLCGNIPLHRARLVTTMWDLAKDQSIALAREAELKREFWQPLIAEGAVAKRFNNTSSSAWEVINELIALPGPRDELLLQEELVEQRKHLDETAAGKVLFSRFQKLLDEQRNTLRELADAAKMENDLALARSLQEEHDKVNAMLYQTFEEAKEMKVSLARRIPSLLLGRGSSGKAIQLGGLPIPTASSSHGHIVSDVASCKYSVETDL